MERERCEILSAYTEHPDMECMWSQREPCGHTCSHVGIKIALALLSFAVCLLFAWNICLQLQLYANMDMSTRCSDIHVHEPLKGEMKTSKTKNSENTSFQGPSRPRRSGKALQRRVTNLEERVVSINAAIYKPVVHLTMSSALNNSVLYSRVDTIGHCYSNIACLRWDSPLEEYREAFHYVKDGYNMPVAIQVRSAGTYNVYAQLAINGNDQSLHYDPTNGYEVVLVRGQQEHVLSRGLVTQDGRGRRYHNTPNKPVDTVPVFGTFPFLCEDMVYVRLLDHTTVSYNNMTSYFGMTRVNPTSGLSGGDYSCDPPAKK
ncbi:uncharacterized protein LOC111136384 isoform X1 [Crassostrea virginica]